VLELLEDADMDENAVRYALSGGDNIWDEEKQNEDNNSQDEEDVDYEESGRRRSKRKKNLAKKKTQDGGAGDDQAKTSKPKAKRGPSPVNETGEQVRPEPVARVPVTQEDALETEICRLEQELMAPRAAEEPYDEDDESIWKPPQWCVPIRADVRSFNFDELAKAQKELTGRLFDVIVTDPPWQLATSNPTRGVALGYEQLGDNFIRDMPFSKLQDNGFLFMWVINAKYRFALSLFELWGYELVDEITWVKQTVNRRLAKSHGFYLQHAKETCLVGRKGNDPPGTNRSKAGGDVIFSERRGQSQKPTEIYETIERLVPGGYYLEIFGRRNNTRDGFLTIGNEL